MNARIYYKLQDSDGTKEVKLVHMRHGLAVRSEYLEYFEELVKSAFTYAWKGTMAKGQRSGMKGIRYNVVEMVVAMFWPGDSFLSMCNPNGEITGKVNICPCVNMFTLF